MRKLRGALVILLFITALIVVSTVTSGGQKSATGGERQTVWKSSVILTIRQLKLSEVVPLPMSAMQAVAYQKRITSVPTATSTTTTSVPPPTTTTTTSVPYSPPPTPSVAAPPPVTTSTASSAAIADAAPLSFGLFPCIEQAESSNRPYVTSGLYGILISTWESLGYSGVPGDASITEQNQAAMTLYDRDGWHPWNDYCTGT